MALFIGNSLARGNILDLSEAESAFHPWWDQVQVSFFPELFLIAKAFLRMTNFCPFCNFWLGLHNLFSHSCWTFRPSNCQLFNGMYNIGQRTIEQSTVKLREQVLYHGKNEHLSNILSLRIDFGAINFGYYWKIFHKVL